MNNLHVKTGDNVMVISGKDKGKTGKVLQTSPKEGKVIVEGLNMVTKHVKPRRQGEQGGIVKAEGAREEYTMARLKEQYVNEIAPALNKKFGYKSVMQIPKLDKVIINVAAGEAKENAKVIDAIVADLGQITGQKAIVCKARKSVANFKLREGMPIGAKVTLRGERMYEFVDRLFNVALPRVRDFRGINGNSFDGRGNYAFGLKEQIIFPEIDFDKVDAIRGMDICFVTTAKTDEEAKELLKALGAPFAN